jgi:hypothetical protein
MNMPTITTTQNQTGGLDFFFGRTGPPVFLPGFFPLPKRLGETHPQP